MSSYTPNPPNPRRPGIPTTVANHEGRITALEHGDIGLWHYLTPIAPAPNPPDLLPSDPIVIPFLGTAANKILDDGSYAPMRIREHPQTQIEAEGAITGVAVGQDICRVPIQFRPAQDEKVVMSSVDGSQAMTVSVSATTGLMTLLALIAGSGGTGLVFDFANDGDWFYMKTTDATGSPNLFGQEFDDESGGGIWIHSNGGDIQLQSNNSSLALADNGTAELSGVEEVEIRSPLEFSIQAGYPPVSTDATVGIITVVGGSPGDNGLSQSNLYLDSDSGLIVLGYDAEETIVGLGFDPEVTVPGPFGTPGQYVFEVMGDEYDSTDTWEWEGGSSQGWEQAVGVGPGPNIGGASPTGFSELGGMAYDVLHGYTIVLTERRHTWTYDGTTWTDLGVVTGTPSTFGSFLEDISLVYDIANTRILAFYLEFSGGYRVGTSEWTGTAWSPITPATTYPTTIVLEDYGTGYDEANSRAVLTIGSITWTFYSGDWHLESPATVPDRHAFPALVYDHNAGKVLMISGERSGANFCVFDIWEWDGTNWTQVTLTVNGPGTGFGGVTLPLQREGAYAAWDGSQTVIFAGEALVWTYASFNDTLRDTWTYDGAGTITFQALSPLPPGRWPGNREAMRCYDPERGKVVIYGGAIDATALLMTAAEIDNGYPNLHIKQGANIVLDL